jgi:hypothetical protein
MEKFAVRYPTENGRCFLLNITQLYVLLRISVCLLCCSNWLCREKRFIDSFHRNALVTAVS